VALNVLLFVPYGFFLHQVTRWRGVTVVLVSLGTSAAIELTQGTGVFGLYPCPYRLFDVDDLILNTLGGAVGVLISFAVASKPWARPERSADLEPPSVPRRILATLIDVGSLFVLVGVAKAVWFRVLLSQQPDAGSSEVMARLPQDVVFGAAAGLLLVVVLPLLRRDRATFGQVVLNVAPVLATTGSMPPGAGGVAMRALVRWAPIIAFGAPALLAVGLVDLVVALRRDDDRSVAGLASRTATATLPAIGRRSEPGTVAPCRTRRTARHS